jgi:hypothetical protein
MPSRPSTAKVVAHLNWVSEYRFASLTYHLLVFQQFTQQVLLAVPHVNNDMAYPAFDYPIIPENYQRRYLAKTPEQLEQEARDAKLREEQRRAAEALTLANVLNYLGFGSGSADLTEDSGSGKKTKTEKVRGIYDGESDSSEGGISDEDGQPTDRRPLQMAVPMPVAFMHLTAVSSHRSVVNEIPEGFDPSFEAEHPSFDAARPRLQQRRKEHVYQSMVHRLKQSGVPHTKQVRFEAAAFDLREHQERRAKSGTFSKYTVAYHDDGLSDDNSVATGRGQHDEGDRESGLITASQSMFRNVQKQQRSVTLIAKPAFVIKSRRQRDSKEKVFINVLHHTAIDDLILSGVITVEPFEQPLTGVGESFTCRDRSGAKCIVYNVLVASSYVKDTFRKYEKRITDPASVAQVCAFDSAVQYLV